MAKIILEKDNGEQILIRNNVSENIAKLEKCDDSNWGTISHVFDCVLAELSKEENITYPQFVRVALFDSPESAKHATYHAALVAENDVYGDVILLEEVDIADRSKCAIPLYEKKQLLEWEWCISGNCEGEVLDRVTKIYQAKVDMTYGCEFLKFDSPEAMLSTIQSDVDLYNVKTEEYVFHYNKEGSIAVYSIDKDKAMELKKKSDESGEYWGGYLGIGGAIWDDPEHHDYVEGNGNLDFCKQSYKEEGWINVSPCKSDAITPEREEQQKDFSGVATAMTYIDNELLDMGDSYEDIVGNLCLSANVYFDADNSAEHSNYLESKSIEAYTRILIEKPETYINDYVKYLMGKIDYLIRCMVYTKGEYADVCEHPTAKAICTIGKYVQSLNNESICDKEHSLMMKQIQERVESVDIELCFAGNDIGYSWYKYFNPELYKMMNSSFTVGYILTENDVEYKFGLYSIHAEIHSKLRKEGADQGYTVAFTRRNGAIVAKFYEYVKTFNPYSISHKDTECEMVVDTTDLEAAAKSLADKANELGKKKYLI